MFPERRLRRLRKRKIQPLFQETVLRTDDLVAPIFIDETASAPVEIASMPGQYRYPLSMAGEVAQTIAAAGIRAVILFGIPARKDAGGTEAYNPDGVIQEAVRAMKVAVPDLVVITDVCACEYTDHGHCGIVGETSCGPDLLNDPSLELMAQIAVSHAEAGADIVAPSCMLDGMVMAIREELDCEGYEDTAIMSYSTKFASSLYGPFRDAADSGFSFGDRTTYQMSPANPREALLESKMDLKEGADILMVKPAGMYLDILQSVASLGLPVAAYQVSGEYAMIKAAAANGWIDEKAVALESLLAIKRAGADLIITYFAQDAAGWLK
ncbi:porphobilinogen synthase [Methanogenium sp. S4BF]|uniref:porphobilinogen synthase n=1 Tax=Methanogenium sp. S4BF TaxID=1789226 RepID=UPI0024168CEC|nr:porphobilinogen synthase [Methanogenium sp. S4BF]WFN34937.1 porphobilinogen synthase [Methanogenium sp. S4BF]